MAHVPIKSQSRAYQPGWRRAIRTFGYLRPALSFRVPDAVQRHSASKTRVNALMAVHR